jgi:hypothetical protein
MEYRHGVLVARVSGRIMPPHPATATPTALRRTKKKRRLAPAPFF